MPPPFFAPYTTSSYSIIYENGEGKATFGSIMQSNWNYYYESEMDSTKPPLFHLWNNLEYDNSMYNYCKIDKKYFLYQSFFWMNSILSVFSTV